MAVAVAERNKRIQAVLNALLFPGTFTAHAACAFIAGTALWLSGSHGDCRRALALAFVALGAWLVAIAPSRRTLGADAGRGRPVFITGCDTGFGNMAARRLSECGFAVFAGCLTPAGADALAKAQPLHSKAGSLTALVLDVTDAKSIEDAVARVEADPCVARARGLWALINNAGVVSGSFADWTSMEAFRHVMEVNFFGAVALTKRCLPLLRRYAVAAHEARTRTGSDSDQLGDSGSGQPRVIMLSSVLGVARMPALSSYVASKHAIDAFTQVLRIESALFSPAMGRVDVVSINPGFCRTPLLAAGLCQVHRAWASAPKAVRAAWGEKEEEDGGKRAGGGGGGGGDGGGGGCGGGGCPFFDAYARRAQALAGVGSPPSLVVDALVQAVCARQPKRRYWCGLDAYLLFRPLALAPDWIVDRLNVAALPRVQ